MFFHENMFFHEVGSKRRSIESIQMIIKFMAKISRSLPFTPFSKLHTIHIRNKIPSPFVVMIVKIVRSDYQRTFAITTKMIMTKFLSITTKVRYHTMI
jgi:hypothetical protein